MKDRIYIDGALPQWKGNLHLHTTRSDGRASPREAIAYYRDAGYHFIMVSDHELYWDQPMAEAGDMLLLAGSEVSLAPHGRGLHSIGDQRHKSLHLLLVYDERLRSVQPPPWGHGQAIPRQADTGISAWNQLIARHKSQGHFVFLCHPRWSRLLPEDLLALEGCQALEIWNHGCQASESVAESGYEWDYCLSRGKRVLAIATDDVHDYADQARQGRGGFTMVSAPEGDGPSLMDALDSGQYYASSGPLIQDLRVRDGRLVMRFSPAQEVRLVAAHGYAPTHYPPPGQASFTSLDWPLDPGLLYVRAEVIGPTGRKAWSQPIFLDDLA